MKVVVPLPGDGHDCVAHRVLANEGVPHIVVECDDGTRYAEVLDSFWKEREGFIIVEHDIAPWVGAIGNLMDCKNDWCVFTYPLNWVPEYSLGCCKFSKRLVRKVDTPINLTQCNWRVVDQNIANGLMSKGIKVCVHTPPVAHAKVR